MSGVGSGVTIVVGSALAGDDDLLEAFAGWIHPAARTVTTIYVRNNVDIKNDARTFLFIDTPDFSLLPLHYIGHHGESDLHIRSIFYRI